MTRRPGVVTWCGLVTVALAAAVLSFASLRHLAVACDTPRSLAWLLPVCIEAAAVAATRVWLAASSPPRARRFARWLALGALGLSVVGNAADRALVATGEAADRKAGRARLAREPSVSEHQRACCCASSPSGTSHA